MTCFVLGCVRLNLANYHVHRNPFASKCTEWSPRLWFGDCIFLRCIINSMSLGASLLSLCLRRWSYLREQAQKAFGHAYQNTNEVACGESWHYFQNCDVHQWFFCMEHYQNPNELAGGESWLYFAELRLVFKHKGNYIIRSLKYSMQHQCNFGLNLHILHSVERVYSKPIELWAEVCVYSSVNLVCESIKTRMN